MNYTPRGVSGTAPDASDASPRYDRVARYSIYAQAAAFTGPEGTVTRPDLIRAMNRLSSAIYLLMIRQKGNEGTS